MTMTGMEEELLLSAIGLLIFPCKKLSISDSNSDWTASIATRGQHMGGGARWNALQKLGSLTGISNLAKWHLQNFFC